MSQYPCLYQYLARAGEAICEVSGFQGTFLQEKRVQDPEM